MRKIAELDIHSSIYSSSKDKRKRKGMRDNGASKERRRDAQATSVKDSSFKEKTQRKILILFSGVIEIPKEIKSLELKYLHVFKPMFES